VGAVKITVDGGFTGPAAYTLEPYKDQGDYRGKLNYTEEELRAIIKAGHEAGWQLGFHAIGDAAIVLTVDAFAEALDALPRDDHLPLPTWLHDHASRPVEHHEEDGRAYHILIAQQPNFTLHSRPLRRETRRRPSPAQQSAAHPHDHGIFMCLEERHPPDLTDGRRFYRLRHPEGNVRGGLPRKRVMTSGGSDRAAIPRRRAYLTRGEENIM
jgi:hypothetical protein